MPELHVIPYKTGTARTVTQKKKSSNRGPPFDSQEQNIFLENWGIRKNTLSAYYPQSNGCTELAVKTVKQILSDFYGRLYHGCAARSLLIHRNTKPPTSIQDLDMYLAMILYDYIIKDHLLNSQTVG